MAELLPSVEIEPADPVAGEPASVLWLHGLGASGHDFEPIVPYLGLPHVRFVFPHAPRRPVTINAGLVMPAWYDITGIGDGGSNERHIAESRAAVEALLERESERVESSRIVLAGFSQGGAIALYTGLRYEQPLAGLLVLSAYELHAETRAAEASEANCHTPILFCHGSFDPLVPMAAGRASCESLAENERTVEWQEFPIGHEVSMPEIELLASWLQERLA